MPLPPPPLLQSFLCVHCSSGFSSNHFQIQIICPLYQSLDTSWFWAHCNSICDHYSAKCVFLYRAELSMDLFQITPNIHYTMIKTPINFHQPLVTFVATRALTLIFLVWIRQSSLQWIFFKFTPNIHFTKIKSPIKFGHLLVIVRANVGPTLFFLCVLYRTDFLTNLLQFHTKCSLGHGQDLSILSPPIRQNKLNFLLHVPDLLNYLDLVYFFFSYQGYGFMITWLKVSTQGWYLLFTITRDDKVIFTLLGRCEKLPSLIHGYFERSYYPRRCNRCDNS